jgi:hypothetical protein
MHPFSELRFGVARVVGMPNWVEFDSNSTWDQRGWAESIIGAIWAGTGRGGNAWKPSKRRMAEWEEGGDR